MCEGGNVRSVGMAYALKVNGQDALAIGWRFCSAETKSMLFSWCDNIILMQAKFKDYVPEEFKSKCRVVDVGEDVYGNPFHNHLQQFVQSVAADWKKKNWEI